MILELLKSGNIKDAYTLLVAGVKQKVDEFAKEYDNDRSIRDGQVGKRKNKSDGTKVSKIPIPFQRKVVNDAVAFLFGSPVNKIPNEDNEAAKEIAELWKSCRMDNMLMDFCEAVKSETEATIIFYNKQKADKTTVIKSRLLTQENGKVYPYFDEYGDLVAFGWEFETKDEEGKDISKMIVFTTDTKYTYAKTKKDWEEESKEMNPFKKIPIVYLSQKEPEWFLVKELIDRFELNFSKFCDTNDYFSAPMLIAEGNITGADGDEKLIDKDESGKMLNVEIVETKNGNIVKGGAKYLTWEHAPEATKLEFETEKDLIYGLTSTPNLTIEAVKGIGQIANAGVTLMFLAPILKAKRSEGNYRTAIDRIINVMIAGLINTTKTSNKAKLEELTFEVNFTSVLPDNIKEIVETLMEANGGQPIMSQETGVAHNPLVKNSKKEIEKINEESSKKAIQEISEPTL